MKEGKGNGWLEIILISSLNESSEDQWFEWLSWLIAAAIAVAIVFFQGRWVTPNVYIVPLGRRDVDWHVDRGIVAVACVERDTIRVWSLPVEQPWWEDSSG